MPLARFFALHAVPESGDRPEFTPAFALVVARAAAGTPGPQRSGLADAIRAHRPAEIRLSTGTMTVMHPITLAALEAFPSALEQHYAAIPPEFVHWAPASWDGVPSEPFTAIELVCHVREFEIEGYQARFRRTLDEDSPLLPSIDSEAVAKERDYGRADAEWLLGKIDAARSRW